LRVKRIDLMRREGGFFHKWNGEKVAAVKHGEGVGVAVFLEESQADRDFGEFVWFPTDEELWRIIKLLYRSDRETHKMLGHGWEGKRPYHMLEDFI
jgi:hypothetical protein